MSDDLERRLSAALQTLTPEPPPTAVFVPPYHDVGEVLDLGAPAGRRRPRTGVLLAAAAVVVLLLTVAAAVVTRQREDGAPVGAPRPDVVPTCALNQIEVRTGDLRRTRTALETTLDYTNVRGAPCRVAWLPILSVSHAIDVDRHARVFPTTTTRADLVLHPGEGLHYDLWLSLTGTCRTTDPTGTQTWYLLLSDAFETSAAFPLEVAGCTVAPVSAVITNRP